MPRSYLKGENQGNPSALTKKQKKALLNRRRYEPNSNQAVQGDFTSLPPITVSNDDSRMNAISELRLTNNPKHLPIAPSSLPTHPLARRCVGDDVSVVYANATDILTPRSANYSSTINNLQSPSSATTSPISIVSQVTPLRPKRIHVDLNRIGGVSNTIDKNLNIGGVTSESVTNFDSSARSVDKVVLNKRKTQEFSPSILTVGEVHPPVSIPGRYTTFTSPKEEVKKTKNGGPSMSDKYTNGVDLPGAIEMMTTAMWDPKFNDQIK